MPTTTTFSRFHRVSVIGLALLLLPLSQGSAVAAQSLGLGAPPAAHSPPPLRAWDRFVRAVDRQGRAEFVLQVEADRYVHLRIDQQQVELAARLYSPGDVLLEHVDMPRSAGIPEALFLASRAGGTYRVVVNVEAGGDERVVSLEVAELRPAVAGDEDRVAAQAALVASIERRWRNRGDEALALAQKALNLWTGLGDTLGQLEAHLEICNNALRSGSDGLACLQRLLEPADVELYPTVRARVLRNLGAWHRDEQPDRARKYFAEALELFTALESGGYQADCLYGIGITFANQGADARALDFYDRALRLAGTQGDQALEAAIWNAIAVVQANRGERRLSLAATERAMELAESNPASRAAILTTNGHLFRRRGQLQVAFDRFSEALKINQQIKDLDAVAKVLGHLGAVYLDLGDADSALRRYEEALATPGIAKATSARTLNQIGLLYLDLEQPDLALPRFQEALAMAREAQGQRLEAPAQHGIGVVKAKLGQAQEAVLAFERALPLRTAQGDRFGQATTLLQLGRAYQAVGRLGEAEKALRDALAIARAAEANLVKAASLSALARLSRDLGRLSQAATEIEEAVSILEAIRSDLPGDRLRSSFFATKRSYYELLVDILLRLEKENPGRGHAGRALEGSEAARARSLLDLLTEGRLNVKRGIDPDLKQQETAISARLAYLQRTIDEVSSERASEEQIASLRDQLLQAEETRRELERTIRLKHARYAEVHYPHPVGVGQIREHLDPRTAFLEYLVGDEGSFLFVVTGESLAIERLPERSAIEPLTRRLLAGLTKADRRLWDPSAARELYRMLVEPARAALKGKSRLLIAPDGPLSLVPFEVLLTEEEAKAETPPFLLREFAIGYVPSAGVLSKLSEPTGPARAVHTAQFLGFADPIYPLESSGRSSVAQNLPMERAGETRIYQLPRLPETEKEVAQIAELYPRDQATIYRRLEAVEGNVKDNPLVTAARHLHFATHAVLTEKRPELSGLVLTRSTREDDDGVLRVYEIFDLELSADLVVLSACETGLGEQVAAEGLVGLSRAFLYAGARSLVVSLWRVRDDSAKQLMVSFYEELRRQGDKLEALRKAKLTMLESDYPFPAHWAPFVLVGHP